MMKPLDGLRVLDWTRVMAGPFCTALLADLGAEVIKLEPPQGDDYRPIGPFVQGESALFTLMNRGKQSIVLDRKDAQAQETSRKVALHCHVIVGNFRPGVAARLGLGPDLRAEKPTLINASISGFGQSGPAAHLPAYDLGAQAISGLMAATGEDGGAPLKVGESYNDLMAGLYASWSILAASSAARQGIRWQLADMATDVRAARPLALANALPSPRHGQALRLRIGAPCHRWRVANPRRLRLFPLEPLARDVRIMRIYKGSSEIQRNIIAAHILN